MIAVLFLASQRYRVLAPETMTADAPADFSSASPALESAQFLAYRTTAGDDSFVALNARKLGLRKPAEVCLVRSDEKAEDGRPIWLLTRVEGRL